MLLILLFLTKINPSQDFITQRIDVAVFVAKKQELFQILIAHIKIIDHQKAKKKSAIKSFYIKNPIKFIWPVERQ